MWLISLPAPNTSFYKIIFSPSVFTQSDYNRCKGPRKTLQRELHRMNESDFDPTDCVTRKSIISHIICFYKRIYEYSQNGFISRIISGKEKKTKAILTQSSRPESYDESIKVENKAVKVHFMKCIKPEFRQSEWGPVQSSRRTEKVQYPFAEDRYLQIRVCYFNSPL